MTAWMRQFYHLSTALAQLAGQLLGHPSCIIGSRSPLEMITKVPVRSAAGGSAYGIMAASSTAPASSPGRCSSSAEAMLAPLENPTATSERSSIPYAALAATRIPLNRRPGDAGPPRQHSLAEPTEEPRHAVLQHRPAYREHRRTGRQMIAQRQQVVLVATSAVQEQQRRALPRHRRRAGRRAADRDPSRRSRDVHVELERWQRGSNLFAVGLQPGRQLEAATKLEQRFIDGEARRVGRDLEQHTSRLAEVDGREVLPIDDLGHLNAMRSELLLPKRLRRQVRRPEGDVMDRAASLPAPITDTGKDINQGARAATGHPKARPVPLLSSGLMPSNSVNIVADGSSCRSDKVIACRPRTACSAGCPRPHPNRSDDHQPRPPDRSPCHRDHGR